MAIHECLHCNKFASLGPGVCWKCGHKLTPKRFDDAAPPGPPNPPDQPGHPPPSGGLIYRCKPKRHFASLSPGLCLLCGGVTEAVSSSQLQNDAAAVEKIVQGMKRSQKVVNDLISKCVGIRKSVSYNLLPSFLYNMLSGSPFGGARAILAHERQNLLAYGNELRAIQGRLRRNLLPGAIRSGSDISETSIARELLDGIDILLRQVLQLLEILDGALGSLR